MGWAYPKILPMSQIPAKLRWKLPNKGRCSNCDNLLLAVRVNRDRQLHPYFCSECDR